MSKYDNYKITTTEDMMYGFIDNMDDDDIDSEIRLFMKYARQLKAKDYTQLVVLIDDTGEFDFGESTVPYVSDTKNGNTFYFFKNESDCYEFIDEHEKYYASFDEINEDDIVELPIDNNTNKEMVKYEIYQLNDSNASEKISFAGYNLALKILRGAYGKNINITADLYDKVYSDMIDIRGQQPSETLDYIFYKFNVLNKPSDFRGHSLSVSDVVVLDGIAYYVDTFGFTELNDFFA